MLLWKVCILINWYELRSNVLCGLLKWFSLKKGINDFFFFWQLFNIIGFLGPVNKRTDNVIQGINRYPKYKKYTPTQTLAKVLVHAFVWVCLECAYSQLREQILNSVHRMEMSASDLPTGKKLSALWTTGAW